MANALLLLYNGVLHSSFKECTLFACSCIYGIPLRVFTYRLGYKQEQLELLMFRNSSHVPNHDSTGILVRARKIAQTEWKTKKKKKKKEKQYKKEELKSHGSSFL
ncbi:hypothetical protein OUZ56_008227 [Daphnia magna]|uniref:Uncharacterized protein n=1 Tax=Daphnia magna TaxID=35525 RepID=A0ABR0ACL1_9CRUS|nr:hypothetical protein OUZ56_008227 [Daphnia magna]